MSGDRVGAGMGTVEKRPLQGGGRRQLPSLGRPPQAGKPLTGWDEVRLLGWVSLDAASSLICRRLGQAIMTGSFKWELSRIRGAPIWTPK